MGMEGQGFNATLYRDGKRVAFVIDQATGGEYLYEWFDFDENKKNQVTINIVHGRYDNKPTSWKGTPEEKLFHEYVDKQPKDEPDDIFPDGSYPSTDQIVGKLIDEYETARYYKRKCKKKTVVITKECKEGQCIVFDHPYKPEYRKHFEQKYGDQLVEIINERFI